MDRTPASDGRGHPPTQRARRPSIGVVAVVVAVLAAGLAFGAGIVCDDGVDTERADVSCRRCARRLGPSVRGRTRRCHRSGLSAGNVVARRSGVLDVPGRDRSATERRCALGPQHRHGPRRRVLPGADRWDCRGSAAVAVRRSDRSVRPLVLAARRRTGRKRPTARVHGRDGRTRFELPHPDRTDRNGRCRRRHRNVCGELHGPTGQCLSSAVRVLDRVRQHLDLPVRAVPSAVRLRPVHLRPTPTISAAPVG